ncbi:MAG: c-type cytochrome [Bdellovibrionota bacterium]
MNARFFLTAGALLGLPLFFALGCTKTPAPAPGSKEALLSRGRVVYQTTCIACHNSDPHKPGAIGPEIWGSPKELVTARIMKAGYPEGYKPKRETHTMPAFPQLERDAEAIALYLNN